MQLRVAHAYFANSRSDKMSSQSLPDVNRTTLGRRELGKLARRKKIREAARQVFREKGFEAATTREIANRADVAIATLFTYAPDKRDLVLMIVNDDLDAMLDESLHAIPPDEGLIDQLIRFFRPRYAYCEADPQLARYMTHFTIAIITEGTAAGAEAERFAARRPRSVAALTELVSRKQAIGEVTHAFAAADVGELLLAIYITEQRTWLSSPVPDAEHGLARLRQLIDIVAAGFAVDRP